MNLDDLVFHTITPPVVKIDMTPDVDPLDADVIDDTVPHVCIHCHVEGSKETSSGVCTVCGAAWDDDTDPRDDFTIALDLLESCQDLFDTMLKRQKVMHKLGWEKETEMRNLAMTVADFLDTYEDYADDDKEKNS